MAELDYACLAEYAEVIQGNLTRVLARELAADILAAADEMEALAD